MPYSRNPFYKLTLAFSQVLPCCFLIIISCNSSNNSENIIDDGLLTIQSTGIISAADSVRIANTCQRWYDTVLRTSNFNGGIIVAKTGQILFEKYKGTGHSPGTDTITQNSPMHIASISKTFTAMAVLKLWQDGKLNIDDEFNRYFPAFNYPGITIRSLLNHRSGLPNYNYFMEALGWDENKYVSNYDILDHLITRKAEMTDISLPNTHFAYCNTNYALLALLIEKTSGSSYADYMNKTFFIPLQMKKSYVFKIEDSSKAIPSYNWRGKLENFNYLDQVYGDKNIYCSARDLLIWDRALSDNNIFTDETLEQAYTPYSNEKPGIKNYGLGWRMNIFPDGKKIIYHNGWWHGSTATFIRLLNENATIIVIGNKFTKTVYQAKNLASLFGDYYGPVDEEEIEQVKMPDPVLADTSNARIFYPN